MEALGEETAVNFSNFEDMAKELIACGEKVEEPLWYMPIFTEHTEGIKRDVADINNCGKSKYADASSAAAFL